MPASRELMDLAAWDELWKRQAAAGAGRLLIFKKSPICPVSSMAERGFRAYLKEAPEGLTIVEVDVVNRRPVSQKIAADTGVRHESPQALLLGPGGKVLWHDSHEGISGESLAEAVGS
ncbi:MAG: bacillithiol system redox-active protein YtxJ [Planctomycetota bacterium]|nr:bacillithiol system redox-active protein YtxJ [Planctomycetota bacterium]